MRKKENRPNNFFFGSICREIGDGQNGDCIDPTSQQMFGGLLFGTKLFNMPKNVF